MYRDDLTLLERWRLQEDAEAFDMLVTRHAGMVFAACKRILRDASDAEDVTQECFLKLAQSGDRVTMSLGGWLHRVATRQALNRLKQDRRRSTRERSFAEQSHKTDLAAWNEIQSHVDEALEQLPEPTRDLIIAHFLNRQTHEAIAAEHGIPRRTVSHRIQRGVDRIREHLASRGIRIGSGALTGALAANTADAVPPALTAALGRLAIAGAASPAGTTTPILGVVTIMKTKLIIAGAAIVGIAGIGLFTYVPRNQEPPPIAITDIEAPDRIANPPATRTEDRARPTVMAAGVDDVLEEIAVPDPIAPGWIQDPDDAISISGFVLDEGGAAISGALVVANAIGFKTVQDIADDFNSVMIARTDPGHSHETRSGRNGAFRIDDIRYAGWIMLSAKQAGYTSSQNDSAMLQLEAGSEKHDVLVVMSAAAWTLKGRVIEKASRKPVANAHVLELNAWNIGTRTDSRGLFSMSYPEQKMVSLQVVSEEYGRATFPEVYTDSQEVVTLEMPSPASVKGVITERGAPAPSVQVVLQGKWVRDEYRTKNVVYGHAEGLGFSYEAQTNADGSFQIAEIDPGQEYEIYLLDVRNKLLSPRAKLGKLLPGTETIWDYQLDSLVTLRGTVFGSESGRPLPDVYVNVYIVEDGVPISQAETQVDPDGSYELRFAAAEGTYNILPNYGPSGSSPTAGESVALKPGDTKKVDLSLLDPWTIKARVVDPDGAPIQVADIMVNIKNQATQVLRTSDQDGNISWGAAAPGQLVWISVSALGYTEADTSAAGIAGQPGEVFDAGDLVLYKTSAGIEGAASTAEGEPLSNVSLTITAHYGPGDATKLLAVSTDDQGRFVIMDGIPVATSYFSVKSHRGEDHIAGETNYFSIASDTVTNIGSVLMQ